MELQNGNNTLTNANVHGEEIFRHIDSILKSTNNKVGDKHIIFKNIYSRDIIRRIFYVDAVDSDGVVTSYHQIKYYYQNAAKNGITGTTNTKDRNLGIIKPGTVEFNNLIKSYVEKGYILCAE